MPKTIGNENTESSGGVSSSILNDTTLGTSVIYSSLQTVGNLQDLSVTGGVTFDSTTFHVDEINDRVGIKTVSPQYPLHVEGQTYVNGNVTCTSVTNSGISENKAITITGYQNIGDFMKVLLTNNVSYFRLSRLGTGANGDINLTNNFSRINTTQYGYGKDDSTLGCQSITLQQDGDIFFSTGSSSDERPISRMTISTTGDVSCYYNLSVSGAITCGSLNGAYINGTCTVTGDFTASSSVSINGHEIQNNVKNSVALTNCTTYGVTTSNAYGYYPDFNMTSNSQNGYVVTYSTNSSTTAFRIFNSDIVSWYTSSNYNAGNIQQNQSSAYIGSQSTFTSNANLISGDYVSIAFPNSFFLNSFAIRFNDGSNYPSVITFCASFDSGTSWIRLKQQNISISSVPITYTLTVPTEFQNHTWNAFRIIVEEIRSTINTKYGAISYFQLFGYPATSSTLTYIPSNVEIGNSILPNDFLDSNYILTVNGNVNVNGYISKNNYQTGEIVFTKLYSNSIGNLTIQNNNITSTSYVTVFQISYTPVSSSYVLAIECDCSYSISAYGGDDWYSQISVNGTQIMEKRQIWINGSGGGTRSSTLFPISAYCLSSISSTTTKTISVQVKRGSSDDTFTATNIFSLKITEIFN